MVDKEQPTNPPDIAWDGESWEAHERAREAREEREWKEGYEEAKE